MTFMSGLAAVTAMLFLWHCRFWALIILVPYALAYFSYRGSIVAAGHYGSALDILINIDRFDLYEKMHLKLPGGSTEEREENNKLAQLFQYDPEFVLEYQHPADTGRSAPEAN